mgnify:CR=1 FL=1
MADFSDQGSPYDAPRSKSGGGGAGKIILWILGILLLLALLGGGCCAGCTYLAYSAGKTQLEESVKSDIRNAPEVQEHIGTLQSVEMSLTDTNRLAQPGSIVFLLKGDKGNGEAIASNQIGNSFASIRLRLPDGQEFELK